LLAIDGNHPVARGNPQFLGNAARLYVFNFYHKAVNLHTIPAIPNGIFNNLPRVEIISGMGRKPMLQIKRGAGQRGSLKGRKDFFTTEY